MKGIKGFDNNLCCNGMQYEVGKEYKKDNGGKKLRCCSDTGYHFCDNLKSAHNYYSCEESKNNRYCEVEALGEVVQEGKKYITDHIKIVREITGEELDVLKEKINGNAGLFNSGDKNSGNYNSGNKNSGDWNSGDENSSYGNSGNKNSGNCNSGDGNSGDYNSGSCNSGDRNSGYENSGDENSGDYNSGDKNSGDKNSGNYNLGDYNSGDYNSGDENSGYGNSGDKNSGNYNSGDENSGYENSGDKNSGNYNSGNKNSGDWNSGDKNSGDWNSCDNESGVFNTTKDKIRMFNKPSNMTYEEWRESKARYILDRMPQKIKVTDDMTNEEADVQKWWDELQDEEKEEVLSLPNFDAAIFKEITGINAVCSVQHLMKHRRGNRYWKSYNLRASRLYHKCIRKAAERLKR